MKELRTALGGISQECLARKIGVSVVSIRRWEKGASEPSLTLSQVRAFLSIIESVGMNLDDFIDQGGQTIENK